MPAAKKEDFRVVGFYPDQRTLDPEGAGKLIWIDGGVRVSKRYDSRAKALAAAAALQRGFVVEAAATIKDALEKYEVTRIREGLKRNTIRTTMRRLGYVLGRAGEGETLRDVNAKRAAALFAKWTERAPVEGDEKDPTLSVYYRRKVLAELRHFWAWCIEEKLHRGDNPWETIRVKGRANRGKPQLRFGQLAQWEEKAVQLAEQGDEQAVAALTALYCGMRSMEILTRRVADRDWMIDPRVPGGRVRVYYVDDDRFGGAFTTKTESSKKPVPIPPNLDAYLERLCAGRKPEEFIFRGGSGEGHRGRCWLRKAVEKICEAAGVDVVCIHSLRGSHGTTAAELGLSPLEIAKALRNTAAVASAHYIAPGAAAFANVLKAVK